ncbi:MAG: LysR family transcriptional regulator [Terrisporobacter sp.]
MTFEQIKSFLAIVKYNHFTLASQELYISQSSISKHIKSLEKELGVELFNRQHRSIRLTEAGEEFYKFAKKSIAGYNTIISDMRKYSCEESTSISIGVIDTMVEYGIATLIGDFQKQYPQIQVDLTERSNKKTLEYLNESIVNLAFINSHYEHNNILTLHKIVHDELVLITSKEHAFSSYESIDIFDTSKEKYLCVNGDYYLHNVFLNTWGNLNYFPNTSYIDSQTKTLFALVSENIGITLSPFKVAEDYKNNVNNNIHICKLKNSFSANIFLAQLRNKRLTKNESLFRDFTLKWFEDNEINLLCELTS